ncbi:hypothetical protein HELRODRAFT_166444 [Helobdella robusta]|uniref:Fibronectin type-III domain-containing protein n=1 Tax=Helobdella robusta TaxID=6412 RepID=T1EY52_HELRO|nr:hypothetical protein HELRODRAFT_166444 [Helobdella robusta]ESN90741.1 hypothetical protein HELRODRAFT_166444 [Helobdella robusta]
MIISQNFAIFLLLNVFLAAMGQLNQQANSNKSRTEVQVYGEITPKEIKALAPANRTLNCTLFTNYIPQLRSYVNSSNMYLEAAKDIKYQIINNQTISATLRLTREDNYNSVHCIVRDFNESYKIGQTQIFVAEPLVRPNVTCVVYNFKVSLNCSWVPAVQNVGVTTTYELTYLYLCKYRHACQHKEGYCFMDPEKGSHIFFLGIYCVNLIVKNMFQTIKVENVFNMDHYVRPAAVAFHTPATINSTWVELNWYNSDFANRRIIYTIEYRMDGSTEVHCIPYVQKYNTSYSEVEMGYTSFIENQSIITFKTLSAEPGANPAVHPGSYYVSNHQAASSQQPSNPATTTTSSSSTSMTSSSVTSSRFVNVFWKPIPELKQHGMMNKTLVTVRSLAKTDDGDVIFVDKFDWLLNGGLLSSSLANGVSYVVGLQSCNEKGLSLTLPSSSFIIPSLARAPKPPEQVYAMVDNRKITLHWSHVSEADNYTVFWCLNDLSTHDCMLSTPLNWTEPIRNDVNATVVMATEHDVDLKVGVSVEKYDPTLKAITSSGVVWAECLHEPGKDVLPPMNVHVSLSQSRDGALVTWAAPSCLKSAHITNYEIVWCRKRSSPCQHDADDDDQTGCCLDVNSRLVDRHSRDLFIKGLHPESQFEFKVRSLTFSGESTFSKTVIYKSGSTKLSNAVTAIIIIIVVLFIIFVVVIGTFVIRKCLKSYKRYKRQISITLPDTFKNDTYQGGPYIYETGQELATLLDQKHPNDNNNINNSSNNNHVYNIGDNNVNNNNNNNNNNNSNIELKLYKIKSTKPKIWNPI